MSINSLTEDEIRRQPRFQDDSVAEGALRTRGAASPSNAAPPSNNALSMLIKYIPTESVTLYVAAASAVPALKGFSSSMDAVWVYRFFGLLTPVLFALILIGKRKTAGEKLLAKWPWWKHFAATVAFFVWALAVPGPPDIRGDTSGVIAGIFALIISTFFSILEPIFDQPAKK